MGRMTIWQTHYAPDFSEALRKTNQVVSLYKDFGWTVDVNAQNEKRIVVTTIKFNGDKKFDVIISN